MAAASLRFLHAAAVQLDCPIRQLGAVPRDTLDLLAAATLTAWERLIDAAVTQGVDGLFLTGDTFDAEAGSLAADVALRQGLERLAEHDIPAFVIPGRLDPLTAWSELPSLPDNVTVFDSAWDAAIDLTDGGRTIAVIQPVSAETDVSPPELDRLRLSGRSKSGGVHPASIGLLWDTPDESSTITAETEAADPRFAALDVLLCRDTADHAALPLTDAKILRQSAPQGMTLAETSSRGATLLQFDPSGGLTTKPITLGPVRRERLTVRLDLARRRDDVADQMLAQLEELPVFPGEQMRLIEWVFAGTDAAWQRLDLTEAAAEETVQTMLELTDQPGRLRYGHQVAPLWQGTDDREQGELWRDYLSLFDQRPAATTDELRALAMELRPNATGATGPWERWLGQLDPVAVAMRSRQYGRRWFAGVR